MTSEGNDLWQEGVTPEDGLKDSPEAGAVFSFLDNPRESTRLRMAENGVVCRCRRTRQ